MRTLILFLFSLVSSMAQIVVPTFNADSVPLPKGTPVAVLGGSNGGFIRANSGSVSNSAFGFLAADAPLGVPASVIASGLLSLPDWTVIAGVSSLIPNSYYFTSATAGKLSSTATGVSQVLGIAVSQTTLLVNVQYLNTNATAISIAASNVVSGGVLPITVMPSTSLIWTNPAGRIKLAKDLNNGTLYLGTDANHSTNVVYAALYGSAATAPIAGDFYRIDVSYFGSNQIPSAFYVTINPIDTPNQKNSETACAAIFAQNGMTNTDTVGWEFGQDAAYGVQFNSNPLYNNSGASVGAICIAQGGSAVQAGFSGISIGFKNGQTNFGVFGASAIEGTTGSKFFGVYGVVCPDNTTDVNMLRTTVLGGDNFATGSALLTLTTNNGAGLAFGVDSAGVATAPQYVIFGTTNQIVFGATNTPPVNTTTPSKWVSVRVTGESTAYRAALYQ